MYLLSINDKLFKIISKMEFYYLEQYDMGNFVLWLDERDVIAMSEYLPKLVYNEYYWQTSDPKVKLFENKVTRTFTLKAVSDEETLEFHNCYLDMDNPAWEKFSNRIPHEEKIEPLVFNYSGFRRSGEECV